MKIVSVGGGPAGLYLAVLMKQADPSHEIRVIERNRRGETFGFGVVFSDATLDRLRQADPITYAAIAEEFAHWDDIDTHVHGTCIRSTGHGFCGLERHTLLEILHRRCVELGVTLDYETEVSRLADVGDADLILAADGVASTLRDELAEHFRPRVEMRPNRFVWLGTTVPFRAFTFIFKHDDAGLWRVHAYRYRDKGSTFIVETTEDTWRRAGMDVADEDATVAYLERLFADELKGHRLIKNRSIWRSFPVIDNSSWSHDNVVLLGDAAHTAHFSIGSGTKLAMEDAIALRDALVAHPGKLRAALRSYERDRRPEVASLQRAAQVSLEWFEDTERYMHLPAEQLTYSLLTRSLRVTHDNLRLRDPEYVADYERWFRGQARAGLEGAPPLFVPFKLRDQQAPNRIVAVPTLLDAAPDGQVGDDYLVHAGARAMGGAGIVIAGVAAVCEGGRYTPRTPGLYRPDQADRWARVVDFIRGRSEAIAAIRLVHAGPRGAVQSPWPGQDRPLVSPWPLIAASELAYGTGYPTPHAASEDELEAVVQHTAQAVELANAAGFELVELDFASGGLVASFLSPLTNRRQDDYGGPILQRARLAGRLVATARQHLPEAKGLAVRICADDLDPEGLGPADAVVLAGMFRGVGADLVTVTAGGARADLSARDERAYSVRLADRVRNEARVPVMAEGGLWSADDACSAVAAGRVDLCGLERAMLFDPSFARRAAHAYGLDLPWPDRYFRARGFRPR